MRLSTTAWAVIVIAAAATVLMAFVILWVIPSIISVQRAGLEIENETNGTWGFDIVSSFRDGHLDVGARSVGTFDVAAGLTVPQSFNAAIYLPNDRALFRGTLNPGVGCRALRGMGAPSSRSPTRSAPSPSGAARNKSGSARI